MLALTGDLVRRLAIANPALSNPLKGAAIVLIDEIDLHLHPQWQRAVIPRLEKTFPHCQFIVSTHSPQVISEVGHRIVSIFCIRQKKVWLPNGSKMLMVKILILF